MASDPNPPIAEPVQPAGVEPTAAIPIPTQDERTMAMLCHLGGALLGFLVPLIIWLIKKDQSKFVDDQGKEALNFHITLLIGHVIGGVLICFTFGLINFAVWVLGIVFGIIGAMAANRGERYRYPFAIRMIT
ncbi:MAG TPA: DUF4870 domain-containing protein [Gemmataceae bacterium]|nr:DUF4870 domain-containing protein [Gemmataceae bacterium]